MFFAIAHRCPCLTVRLPPRSAPRQLRRPSDPPMTSPPRVVGLMSSSPMIGRAIPSNHGEPLGGELGPGQTLALGRPPWRRGATRRRSRAWRAGLRRTWTPARLPVTAFLDRRDPEAPASPNIDALRRSAAAHRRSPRSASSESGARVFGRLTRAFAMGGWAAWRPIPTSRPCFRSC